MALGSPWFIFESFLRLALTPVSTAPNKQPLTMMEIGVLLSVLATALGLSPLYVLHRLPSGAPSE